MIYGQKGSRKNGQRKAGSEFIKSIKYQKMGS